MNRTTRSCCCRRTSAPRPLQKYSVPKHYQIQVCNTTQCGWYMLHVTLNRSSDAAASGRRLSLFLFLCAAAGAHCMYHAQSAAACDQCSSDTHFKMEPQKHYTVTLKARHLSAQSNQLLAASTYCNDSKQVLPL
jgi:hypothetical protein